MLEIKYINFIDYHAPTTVKYHVHDCYELVYYHSGSGTVLYDEYNKQNVSRSIRASKLNSSDDFLKERILYLNKSHSETEKRDTFTANTYYISRRASPFRDSRNDAFPYRDRIYDHRSRVQESKIFRRFFDSPCPAYPYAKRIRKKTLSFHRSHQAPSIDHFDRNGTEGYFQ